MLMSVSDIGTTATGTSYGWLLPALLVLCLAVIAVLAAVIVRQRRLINLKNKYIARYVGQYLSFKYNELPELCKWYSGPELTQMELIKVMHLLKKMLYGCVLLLPTLPAVAQERTDTTYVFRFVPTDDMFYVPFGGNGAELERLENCVERYYDEIRAGFMPLRVDGYSCSESDRQTNLQTAKLRSNRIKSELITRQGLTEDCFITKNHAGKGDYVTVRLTIPKEEEKPAVPDETEKSDNAFVAKEKETPAEEPQTQSVQAEQPATTETMQTPESLPTGEVGGTGSFSLRANLLRWATLTPDLGIEWRINRLWGILVHGSWTSWSWSNKDRRYALWEVSPEVRHYMGKEKRGYLGAMYKAGAFNYKLSATGRQGDLMGGGITGGYGLRLNDALSLDFNLAVGCLHADYEKYEVIDGVRVRQGKESKNWWGPINAGVTLVWKMKN